MVAKAPLAGNPLAVLIVAFVGWIVIRLMGGLLREAGIDLGTTTVSAESEADGDGAHGHGDGGDGHSGEDSWDGGCDERRRLSATLSKLCPPWIAKETEGSTMSDEGERRSRLYWSMREARLLHTRAAIQAGLHINGLVVMAMLALLASIAL